MRYANHRNSSLGCGLDHRKAALLAFGDTFEHFFHIENELPGQSKGNGSRLISGAVNYTR